MSTWKTSIRRFFLLQVVLLVIVLIAVTSVSIYSRISQAKLLGSAVRNDFVIGDTRNVISALNYALPLGFVHIKATGANGREIFEVGDKSTSDRFFTFEYLFYIWASSSSDGASLGKIHFYYSVFPMFLTSIWIWVLFLVLSMPLIVLENRRLRKEYEKNLLLKEAEIRHSIAVQVAHDIRSPLSVLNLISSKISEVEDVKELYSNAIKRINEIANDLLSFRKEKTDGFVEAQISGVLVSKIANDLFEEKKSIWADKLNLVFSLDLNSREEALVKADASGLMRSLSNILNNSFESLNDEAGEIILGTRETSTHIIFYVLDNGSGMSEDTLKLLGQKGYTKGKENGHGLGIFGAKNFVIENKGTFEVKSKLGSGTLIEIQLPIC